MSCIYEYILVEYSWRRYLTSWQERSQDIGVNTTHFLQGVLGVFIGWKSTLHHEFELTWISLWQLRTEVWVSSKMYDVHWCSLISKSIQHVCILCREKSTLWVFSKVVLPSSWPLFHSQVRMSNSVTFFFPNKDSRERRRLDHKKNINNHTRAPWFCQKSRT